MQRLDSGHIVSIPYCRTHKTSNGMHPVRLSEEVRAVPLKYSVVSEVKSSAMSEVNYYYL